MLDGQFSFLNRKDTIGWPPDWNRHDLPKLWLYHLHYFEYLWSLSYEQAKALVLDWIENHPLRERQVGWESYPTSLRLMNLCGVFFSKYQTHISAATIIRLSFYGNYYWQNFW